MHAKQRNPSRILAQEVAQKGPGCDAKVCLTRPSNPLKTLGPEPRLVCFIQRSNPIQTLLPHPRQRDACETAKPQQDSSPRGGPKRSRMRRQGVPNPTFEPVKNTRTGASAGMLYPTFKPYTDTFTAPSAARPKRRNTTVCLTRPSNRWETPAPEPRLARTSGLNSCLTFVSRPCTASPRAFPLASRLQGVGGLRVY